MKKSVVSRLLCLALLSVGASRAADLVINEIMFHPPTGLPEDVRLEWVELFNK